MGGAEDDDVEHARDEPDHRVLDRARGDLEAAGVDEVVRAAADLQPARFGECAEVVGPEPADPVGVGGAGG